MKITKTGPGPAHRTGLTRHIDGRFHPDQDFGSLIGFSRLERVNNQTKFPGLYIATGPAI